MTTEDFALWHSRLLGLAGRLALAMESGLRRLPEDVRGILMKKAGAQTFWGLALLLASWRQGKQPQYSETIQELLGETWPRVKRIHEAFDELAPLIEGFVVAADSNQAAAGARFAEIVQALYPRMLAFLLSRDSVQLSISALVARLRNVAGAGNGPPA